MPVTLRICEDGHVFHYVYTDPWDLRELLRLDAEQVRPHLESVNYKVHSVVDLRGSHEMPSGILRTRVMLAGMRHPNSGVAAVVGASQFVRVLNEVVTRLSRFDRGAFFETEDQAWNYIRDLIAKERQSGTGAMPGDAHR